jgi:hypothetical protein
MKVANANRIVPQKTPFRLSSIDSLQNVNGGASRPPRFQSLTDRGRTYMVAKVIVHLEGTTVEVRKPNHPAPLELLEYRGRNLNKTESRLSPSCEERRPGLH